MSDHHHHHHHLHHQHQPQPSPPQFPPPPEDSHQHHRHHHHHHHHHEPQPQPQPQPQPRPPPQPEEDSEQEHHIPHHHHKHDPENKTPQYGTFDGFPSYPKPIPPLGAIGSSAYAHGYQAVPGYPVAAAGGHVREPRLPCCGLGYGWCLFIIGFVLGSLPWYIGAIILLCGKFDHRERPGYIACAIAAVLAAIGIAVGAVTIDW